ncbi:hypothetical protein DUNSADRAFT_8118, partial [Dunaliella salina]
QPEVTFAETEETYKPVCDEAVRASPHSLDGVQQPSLQADVGQQLEDILSMTTELARDFVQGEDARTSSEGQYQQQQQQNNGFLSRWFRRKDPGPGASPQGSGHQPSANQPREGGSSFLFSQFAFPSQDI